MPEIRKPATSLPEHSTLDLNQVALVEKLIPNAQIIFLMRNPIYRAWSQIRMEARKHTLNLDEYDTIIKKLTQIEFN